ncbi:hypothetical protein RND81_11G095600 [Saponaria officinalis]|uniref:Uncharacterized protein n=1 Tax=Saponaria officinalis TaxID=3572 RepID=A0AAW1HJX8_SAPOF
MAGTRANALNEEADRLRTLETAVLLLAQNVNNRRRKKDRTVFEKSSRLRPPSYAGIVNPVALESWIRETEKLFEVADVPAHLRETYPAHYLTNEGDRWWETSKVALTAQPDFGWAKFK